MIHKRVRIFVILLMFTVSLTRKASAHRDDYLNETLVYLTLERGEVEAEYWFDYGTKSGGRINFARHNTAFEWGITDRWMLDGRGTVVIEDGHGTNFDSARLESRYKFFDEGVLPVDIAASFEVNSEREPDGSTTVGIEPQLILSKDLGKKLNLTANLSEEIPLDSGSPDFLVAFGSRYNWTKLFRVGSEFQYNIDERSGQVIPQIWITFLQDVTVKMGYSSGIDREPNDFFRVALEVEF